MILAAMMGFFPHWCHIGLYTIGPALYQSRSRVTGVGLAIGVGRLGAIAAPLCGWSPAGGESRVGKLDLRRVCNAAGFGCICRALHIASECPSGDIGQRPTDAPAMVVSTMGREGDAGEGKFLEGGFEQGSFG